MKPYYVAGDYRWGCMIYQPLRTIILPMTMPSFAELAIFKISPPSNRVMVQDGSGHFYICEDLTAQPVIWKELVKGKEDRDK